MVIAVILYNTHMLQDTYTADGAFSHAFKAYQLQAFINDILARG